MTGQTTHVVQGLNSFQNYSIGVYLESNLGRQSSVAVTFQTLGRGESTDCISECTCVCVYVCVCVCGVCVSVCVCVCILNEEICVHVQYA